MKKYLLVMFLFFTSCEIEEVLRQPLLASPLGLEVKKTSSDNDTTGLVLYFTANNPEIYFSGFSIYVSTKESDFSHIGDDTYWPTNPLKVTDNQARLLSNYNHIKSEFKDCTMSIYVGGEMAFPERRTYPEDAVWDSSTSTSSSPEFIWTSFSTLPSKLDEDENIELLAEDDFAPGTTYYFAAYSYSSIDDEYSLPSNIASITFP